MSTKTSLEEKFRETGGKRPYVQRLFARIARIYDLMNLLMSFGLDRRWRAFAARYLALGSGELGLDLGTGTADLSIAVIRRSGPGTRMIGKAFQEYNYLPHSLTSLPDAQALKAIMEEVGWSDVRFYRHTGRIVNVHVGTKMQIASEANAYSMCRHMLYALPSDFVPPLEK